MFIIKSKTGYGDAICLIITEFRNAYEQYVDYESSICDEKDATQFETIDVAKNVLKELKLSKEYKVVKIK